jgi:hypothetical protein
MIGKKSALPQGIHALHILTLLEFLGTFFFPFFKP